MISEEEFCELIRRIRSGDEVAANDLVALYEPEIRRAARLRLTDPEMRRLVDSIDISQSVFGRFFHRVDQVELDLRHPDQLLALLTRMASNRVIDEHRKRKSAKRGGESEPVMVDMAELQHENPGPKTAAISKDLLESARSKLTPEELRLLDARCRGETWDEIATAQGESAERLRKRLQRSLQRVREEMNDQETSC